MGRSTNAVSGITSITFGGELEYRLDRSRDSTNIMSGTEFEFPALYQSADNGSNLAQGHFLWIIKWEYFLLFCVSGIAATRTLTGISPLWISIFLVVLAGLFVYKVFKKKDQDWYQCRALAESIKTATWRFTMRAHPFGDATNIEVPKSEFRNLLHDILRANQRIAENLHDAHTHQVTNSMIMVRGKILEERISYYVTHRIDDQRSWYVKKSAQNRKALRLWVAVTIGVYVAAAVSLNAEELGVSHILLAFDPLIVLATSALGWLQMKRHGELIASYNLTAHEIGIIRARSDAVRSEEEFSDFVNEAELAFSREHTQWVARRDAN